MFGGAEAERLFSSDDDDARKQRNRAPFTRVSAPKRSPLREGGTEGVQTRIGSGALGANYSSGGQRPKESVHGKKLRPEDWRASSSGLLVPEKGCTTGGRVWGRWVRSHRRRPIRKLPAQGSSPPKQGAEGSSLSRGSDRSKALVCMKILRSFGSGKLRPKAGLSSKSVDPGRHLDRKPLLQREEWAKRNVPEDAMPDGDLGSEGTTTE